MFFQTLSAVILVLLTISPEKGSAAEITVIPTGSPVDLITISGELAAGDADYFDYVTAGVDIGAVLLESPGGSLIEGLRIGEIIRARGFSTGVAPRTACASACALAWLGGKDRYMDSSSLIGFHAAYELSEGQIAESGVGNALVGAYLTKLGLGLEAVVFATSAGPDDMAWLNAAQARASGINLTLIDEHGTETAMGTTQLLRLPSGFRWIVLESNLVASSLSTASFADQIVKTQSGYFASVLGPFREEVARSIIAQSTLIPDDAYLSSGNGFLFALR